MTLICFPASSDCSPKYCVFFFSYILSTASPGTTHLVQCRLTFKVNFRVTPIPGKCHSKMVDKILIQHLFLPQIYFLSLYSTGSHGSQGRRIHECISESKDCSFVLWDQVHRIKGQKIATVHLGQREKILYFVPGLCNQFTWTGQLTHHRCQLL